MSATTGTRQYQLVDVRYNINSEELTRIDVSPAGNLDLGFELTPEMQPTALMVFTSVFPKKYEEFIQRRSAKEHCNEASLTMRLIHVSDAWKIFSSRNLQQLRERGLLSEDE